MRNMGDGSLITFIIIHAIFEPNRIHEINFAQTPCYNAITISTILFHKFITTLSWNKVVIM